MSGPEISYYEKSILGCGLWSGLDCEMRGSGPIMSNFKGTFFKVCMDKKLICIFFENILGSVMKSCIA